MDYAEKEAEDAEREKLDSGKPGGFLNRLIVSDAFLPPGQQPTLAKTDHSYSFMAIRRRKTSLLARRPRRIPRPESRSSDRRLSSSRQPLTRAQLGTFGVEHGRTSALTHNGYPPWSQ